MGYVDRVSVQLTALAGNAHVSLSNPVSYLRFTGQQPRDLSIYDGYGTSSPICRIRGYEQRDIELPSPVNTLTVQWGDGLGGVTDLAKIDFVASAEPMATTGGQATTIALGKSILGEPEIWSSAANSLARPENVSLVSMAIIPRGSNAVVNPWDGIPVQRNTYHCTGRRLTRTYVSATNLLLNTRAPLSTLWLSSAGTPVNRLVRAEIALIVVTAACDFWADLVRIDSQPTGGQSLPIVGSASSTPNSWSVVRQLPTGGAAESSGPIGATPYRLGITGADQTVNPITAAPWIDLFGPTIDTQSLPTIADGQGWAIIGDTDTTTIVRFVTRWTWIEESN